MGGKTSAKSKNEWIAKAYDRINLTLPKGQKDIIKAHAESQGESVNGFISRAIENQMFLVLSNSTGKSGDTEYGGASRIIDPWGEVLASMEGRGENIISANLDMSIINGIRNSINVFSDRRSELYNVSKN